MDEIWFDCKRIARFPLINLPQIGGIGAGGKGLKLFFVVNFKRLKPKSRLLFVLGEVKKSTFNSNSV